MKLKSIFILSFLCFASHSVFASEKQATAAANLAKQHTEAPDQYAGKLQMNGFKLKDFENFEKNWKLVTVRHREDTKEMRFTYANDVAYEALTSGKTDYPKGAVFAKIGFSTNTDPLFESSVVPSGARRYQFMVRDVEKFKDTDGWGYALFNSDGRTFNGEPQLNSMACAACHKIAQSRGYVFSQMTHFSPFKETTFKGKTADQKVDLKNLIKFNSVKTKSLPAAVARHLPNREGDVEAISGALKEHIFEGTLNEVIPLLIQNTLKTKKPSILSNEKGDLFSLAYIDTAEDQNCPKPQVKVVTVRAVQRDSTSATLDGRIIKINELCKAP